METWISYQKFRHRIKITSDRDCLPPDATFVKQYGDWNEETIKVCAEYLRAQGYTVEVEGDNE